MLDDEVACCVPIHFARLDYGAETADGGYRINDETSTLPTIRKVLAAEASLTTSNLGVFL